jgi:DHA1 family bicyclomycin/chloramphenicol resistance-like MFS transporter
VTRYPRTMAEPAARGVQRRDVRFARMAVVLGVLTAISPFAIDMYLPALPELTRDLGTRPGLAQQTLTAYLCGFGLCQLWFGPWSDRVGRKLPFYTGMSILALGSVACALAPGIEWLIGARIVQGVGAASATVLPRAIVRDLYTGHDATRLMALVMVVFSVSPIFAPLTGTAIIAVSGWRGVFVGIGVMAVLALGVIWRLLPETRPPSAVLDAPPEALTRSLGVLLRDGQFVGIALANASAMAGLILFLANSSFIYIEQYALGPLHFSLCFAVNGIAFVGSAQFAGRLTRRFGPARVVRGVLYLYVAFALALAVAMLASHDRLLVLVVGLVLVFACLGIAIPTMAVLALDAHGRRAGTASAFLGTAQMTVGGLVLAVLGTLLSPSAGALAISIAVCGAVSASIISLVRLPGSFGGP